MFGMNYITHKYTDRNFKLVHDKKAASVYFSIDDYPGVIRAIGDLKDDISRVSSIIPNITSDKSTLSGHVVIVGTIGKNDVIDQLIAEDKLDVEGVIGKWESFVIQTVERPMAGVEQALVIAGSDKRGTIFGIYDVSEKIGVSPWYWWADMPAQQHDTLIVKSGIYKQGEPSVKYRGIFLNDEGPSLMTWVRKNYQDFTHEFYERIFELTLRLKANYHWPAMWDNTFYEDDVLNPAVADMYGVVMGTSHHEPMMRPHGDWKKHKQGPWDYSINEEYLYQFWDHGIERSKDYESIVTLGMRGDGDEAMGGQLTFQEKIELLQKIIEDQRQMIADHMEQDVSKVPQLWALYKEVQDYYEHGMRVPDDITLLWADDNFGNLRRVPTEDERARTGGAGIYYHLDYVGGPRSYKWVNSTPLPKIWEQMHKAFEYGADRIWILNVGDLKPMEFQLEYFLRLAWNMDDFTKDNAWEYSVFWATRNFGEEYAEDIAKIINGYSKFNGRLKPEQLNNVELYSQLNYQEADRVLAEFRGISKLAEDVYENLPEKLKDPFFQIVLYPAKASLQVMELHLQAEKSRLYAAQGRVSANIAATKAEHLFLEDAAMSFDYNKRTALGKWNHMMDQTRIGYTYWQQPEENTMPDVYRVDVRADAAMGVIGEQLQLNNYTRESRYIDIYNKGLVPFTFDVEASEGWIQVSITEGMVIKEKRIWVTIDWDAAPKGEQVEGKIIISGSEETTISLEVTLFNPIHPARESLIGFMETDGYISIEAEHYTKKTAANDASWEVIPDYGRTKSSMAIFPVTTPSVTPPEDSPCLEYQVYVVNPGELNVKTLIAPTLNFLPDQGVRIGVSFDDQPVQIVDAVKYEDGGFHLLDWEKSVILNIREVNTTHSVVEEGYHTLKIWMVDPIVVLQKIIIDTGGLKPSYLGPPESYYGGKPEDEMLVIENDNVDSFTIPGPLYGMKDLQQFDVFVETSGFYEFSINAVGHGSLQLECDGRPLTETLSVDGNHNENVTTVYLEKGDHSFQVHADQPVELESCHVELVTKDVFTVRPSLRADNMQVDTVIAQIGILNEDIYSHRFILNVSLLDEKGGLLHSVSTTNIAERTSKEMYNFSFNASSKGSYTLKIDMMYEDRIRNYEFDYHLNS